MCWHNIESWCYVVIHDMRAHNCCVSNQDLVSSDFKQRSCLPNESLVREQITPFKNFFRFYVCRQSIGKSLTVSKSDPSLADSAEGDNSPSHTSSSSTSSEHSGAVPTVSIQASSPENVDTSTAVSIPVFWS